MNNKTLKELKSECKKRKIGGYSKMNKSQLIKALYKNKKSPNKKIKKQRGGVTGISDTDKLISGFLNLSDAENLKKVSKQHKKDIGQAIGKREFNKDMYDRMEERELSTNDINNIVKDILSKKSNDVLRYIANMKIPSKELITNMELIENKLIKYKKTNERIIYLKFIMIMIKLNKKYIDNFNLNIDGDEEDLDYTIKELIRTNPGYIYLFCEISKKTNKDYKKEIEYLLKLHNELVGNLF